MLETLDAVDFGSLEDAYGPAVDVPARLRALAFGAPEDAQTAIGELAAGIFHQGSYYAAAAPTIPFLIEIAAHETPARASVLRLLADMSAARTDAIAPFDPYVFRSMPGASSYPEAVSAIEAFQLGRDAYVAALQASDPEVRVAAVLAVSCVGREPEVLAEALARETDEAVEVGMRIALVRAGGALPPGRSPLGVAVTRALGALLDETAVETLLLAPTIPPARLPFFDGELVTLGVEICRTHQGDPRVWDLLRRALEARFARGEKTVVLGVRPPQTVSAPQLAPFDFDDYDRDRGLRAIASGLVEIAFGDRAHLPELLRREDLDERMRWVLSLTIDHALPVPVRGAPWIDARSMRRFLDGGGPLDRVIEVDGVRAPVYALLGPAQGDIEAASRVLAATLAWDDDALFDLVTDIQDDGYGLAAYGGPHAALAGAIDRVLGPRFEPGRVRLERRARSLAASVSFAGAAAAFALRPWILALEPTPPELDRVAAAAIVTEKSSAWLKTFPEPRRSRFVARMGNPYFLGLFADDCDQLEPELIRAFLAPDCAWMLHDADRALAYVSTSSLEAIRERLDGARSTIVRRALRARTGEGIFTLVLETRAEGVHASLVDWTKTIRFTGMLSSSPMTEELAPIARAMEGTEDPLVDLSGDLDHTTRYRVMRMLPEAGFRGTIQDGNTTMSR